MHSPNIHTCWYFILLYNCQCSFNLQLRRISSSINDCFQQMVHAVCLLLSLSVYMCMPVLSLRVCLCVCAVNTIHMANSAFHAAYKSIQSHLFWKHFVFYGIESIENTSLFIHSFACLLFISLSLHCQSTKFRPRMFAQKSTSSGILSLSQITCFGFRLENARKFRVKLHDCW